MAAPRGGTAPGFNRQLWRRTAARGGQEGGDVLNLSPAKQALPEAPFSSGLVWFC